MFKKIINKLYWTKIHNTNTKYHTKVLTLCVAWPVAVVLSVSAAAEWCFVAWLWSCTQTTEPQNITQKSWRFVLHGLWLWCCLCLLQPSDVSWPDFDLAHRRQSHKISHKSLDALCCMACGCSVVCVCCSRVTFHGLTLILHAELFHKSLDAFLLHGLWLWWPVSPVCVCSGLSGHWTLWCRTMTVFWYNHSCFRQAGSVVISACSVLRDMINP